MEIKSDQIRRKYRQTIKKHGKQLDRRNGIVILTKKKKIYLIDSDFPNPVSRKHHL